MPPEDNNIERRIRMATEMQKLTDAVKQNTTLTQEIRNVLPVLDNRTTVLETTVETQGKCLTNHKNAHQWWHRRIIGSLAVMVVGGAVLYFWEALGKLF